MTEQEAKTWRKRLRRIWGPVVHQLPVRPAEDRVFDAVLKPDVRLEVRGNAKLGRQEFFLRFFSRELRWVSQVAELRASQDGMITRIHAYEEDKELATQFAAQWLPLFRRNCWLSGCPLEASAHEKAEWMQGFSREELDAWNLNI